MAEFAYEDLLPGAGGNGEPQTPWRLLTTEGVEVVEGPGHTWTWEGEAVTREYGKMGKSLKNVVTPDEMCDTYGADTFRVYEMSMGPLDASRPWETRAVVGSQRFLQRLWRNVVDEETGEVTQYSATNVEVADPTDTCASNPTCVSASAIVDEAVASAGELGKKVIELEDATVTTPDGRTLVDHLTWRLAPGERIGLVGVNGSGKTTLLRTLAGEYPLAAGKRIEGQTTRIGWLRQELDDLDPTRRVIDAVEDVATYIQLGGKDISASQLAERLGFSPKRQRTPVGDLSGGERRRLQLTRVLMAEPNVLLLDEPTNNLDPQSREQVLDALKTYTGAVVLVTHDPGAVRALEPERVIIMPEGDEDMWSDEYMEIVELA